MQKNEEEKSVSFIVLAARKISYLVIPTVVYSLGSLPTLFMLYVLLRFFNFNFMNLYHILFLPFFVIFEIYLFISCESLVSAIAIKILRVKYSEGEYDLYTDHKILHKMTMFHLLYFFPIKLLDVFDSSFLKKIYLKMIGAKIGKNTTLGTVGVYFLDPCLVEIGDNVYVGSYAVFTCHIIDQKKLIIGKIKIGDNSIIGGETLIMPGVTLEENVTVGNKSLVTRNKTLNRNKIYAGIPAKELRVNDE